MDGQLYYGDNLEVLQKHINDETVDLCYIDPPFNSKRNYNQIYSNVGQDDFAQANAFVDTWNWNSQAEVYLAELKRNPKYHRQLVETVLGFERILGKGSMLSYLVNMAVRLVEIWRVLKPSGSFYLHCDPTASHYLKILLDSIFGIACFQNEIIWKRYAVHSLSSKRFDAINDVILFYAKNAGKNTFNPQFECLPDEELKKRFPYTESETGRRFQHVALEQSANKSSRGENRYIQGKKVISKLGWRWSQATFDERLEKNPDIIHWTSEGRPRYKIYADEYSGKPVGSNWIDIPYLSAGDKERLGYTTQKPLALLERIIKTSSKEGDTVLDAFCGCGTTVDAAQSLKRKWIGVDITYNAVSLILKRLTDRYGKRILKKISLSGIPRDIESARALAHKQDDRLRKEFEKWVILTYTDNQAKINDKKGADRGIDGIVYTVCGTALFSVKSGKVSVKDVRELWQVVEKNNAAAGILITLEEPTKPMLQEAAQFGHLPDPPGLLLPKKIRKLQIVTVTEIMDGRLTDLPVPEQVVKSSDKIKVKETKTLS